MSKLWALPLGSSPPAKTVTDAELEDTGLTHSSAWLHVRRSGRGGPSTPGPAAAGQAGRRVSQPSESPLIFAIRCMGGTLGSQVQRFQEHILYHVLDAALCAGHPESSLVTRSWVSPDLFWLVEALAL